MSAHVFIVNDDTFPVHLQYLFAGTGASHGAPRNPVWVDWHIGLLSDIKRIRVGDIAIFYMEGTAKFNGFFGIFRIANQNPIVFHTPQEDGFQPHLPRNKLIYRTLLEPYEVYSHGVPEWEALDKLPIYSAEIQWSLIYRKLKGKRGCTPLLPWEAQRLTDMIRTKNSGNPIANSEFGGRFNWDLTNRKIISIAQQRQDYTLQRQYQFNPTEAISHVQNSQTSFETCLRDSRGFDISPQYLRRNRSYEGYLQLYFTENVGKEILSPIVGNNISWFGNEVACGVGMQKIDILTILHNGARTEYRLVELKDEPVQPGVTEQIDYYVNWASQDSGRHLPGAFNWNMQPVVVAPSHNPRNWQSVTQSFRDYNNKQISLPILYFEFRISADNAISFGRIDY